jgi:hypothetical protein
MGEKEPEPQMDKKTKVFFAIFLVGLVVSIAFSWHQYMVVKDFEIVRHDASTE